jgi:RNA polymerase sigma-70 factor (ECF subfamily)
VGVRELGGMALHSLDRPDTLLVDELRQGSTAALATLFDRHVDAVYTFCFRRTASWHLAEDATSTVFLELWRGRSKAQEHDGSALPWLYGIARNVCRNGDRSARRLNRALRRLPGGESLVESDVAEDVIWRVDSEREMARVLAAVARLPAHERDVLELVVWAGLSYEATATALGIPVGTVRSRLSRARGHLTDSTTEGTP